LDPRDMTAVFTQTAHGYFSPKSPSPHLIKHKYKFWLDNTAFLANIKLIRSN